MDWLLLPPYLLIQGFAALLFCLTGGLARRRLFASGLSPEPGGFRLCLDYAAGLALWSFLITLVGLAGWLNRPVVGGMAALGFLAGLWDLWHTRPGKKGDWLKRSGCLSPFFPAPPLALG